MKLLNKKRQKNNLNVMRKERVPVEEVLLLVVLEVLVVDLEVTVKQLVREMQLVVQLHMTRVMILVYLERMMEPDF